MAEEVVSAEEVEAAGEETSRHNDSIVIIDGTNGAGTGFVTEIRGSLWVVTNLHVLSGNDTFSVRTVSGQRLQPERMFGAVGHDVAILRIGEGASQPDPLPFETDIHEFAAGGDDVLVIGNSEGSGTVLKTPGNLLGLGPDRIEIDNPVYPGNSGSPILHEETGRVIGVVSFAKKADQDDFVTAASREDERSAVSRDVRYFGYRLDSVETWERIEWARFREEAAVLDAFHEDSLALHSLLFTDNRRFEQNARLKQAVQELDRRTSGSQADVQRAQAIERFFRTLGNSLREGKRSLERRKRGFYDHHQRRAEIELELREILQDATEDFRSDFRRHRRQIIR